MPSVEVAGRRIDVPSESYGSWVEVAEGAWEPWTVAWLKDHVDSASTVIDIGAHVGYVSVVAAALGAEVQAYEPDPVAAARFRQVLELNPDLGRRIRLDEVALSDKAGTATLVSASLGDSTSRLVELTAGESVPVTVVAIGDVLREDAWRRSTVLKIDVEGSEYRLLPHLARFYRHRPVQLLVSTHASQYRHRVARLPRIVRGPLWRLRAFFPHALLMWRVWRLGDVNHKRLSSREWTPFRRRDLFLAVLSPTEREFAIDGRKA